MEKLDSFYIEMVKDEIKSLLLQQQQTLYVNIS